ncbi:hypothetical protein ACFFU1_07285 [Algibacter miyuki]|uniref:Uncharacterized protein n=1 Tax=Algibacter miyuki TaxID=1306933 RepID=A0ABV5GYH2_9FLAO
MWFALGIAADSPQPDAGSARTCSGKPDPCGNAQKTTAMLLLLLETREKEHLKQKKASSLDLEMKLLKRLYFEFIR